MKKEVETIKKDYTYCDNPEFNVKGISKKDFIDVIELAFRLTGNHKACGWKLDKAKGIVLFWSETEECKHFKPAKTAKGTAGFVWGKLKKLTDYDIELKNWDMNADIDGSTEMGWRVYTEKWGHIDNGESTYGFSYEYSFLAVTPSYLWYGK